MCAMAGLRVVSGRIRDEVKGGGAGSPRLRKPISGGEYRLGGSQSGWQCSNKKPPSYICSIRVSQLLNTAYALQQSPEYFPRLLIIVAWEF